MLPAKCAARIDPTESTYAESAASIRVRFT